MTQQFTASEVRDYLFSIEERSSRQWLIAHDAELGMLRQFADLFEARERAMPDADEWHALRERAERAEAELAALKARIAGSRHAFLGPNMDRITFLADEIGPNGKYALVKVEE